MSKRVSRAARPSSGPGRPASRGSSTPDADDSTLVVDPRPAPGEDDTSGPPLGLTFAVIGAALLVCAWGMGQYSSIVAPAFFAVTMVLTVQPLRAWLHRVGLPAWLASVVSVVVLYLVIFGLMFALGLSLQQLTNVLPVYADKFAALYQQGLGVLAQFGLNIDDVKKAAGSIDLGKVASLAQAALSSLSSASSQVGFLVIVIAFLIVDTGDVRGRLGLLRQRRPHLANALADFAVRVRKYWAVNTIFGAVVAIIDVVFLMIMKVPLYGTWGVIAFVTNYIPNIGFVLGVIPPALLALLVGGPIPALIVVIGYSAINFIIQSVVQPKFTGDAVGLNTTVTFVSLVLWTAVVGPFGAILAVPLTLAFKSLFIDSDPRMQWLNVFLRAKDSGEEQVEAEQPDAELGGQARA